MGLSVWMTLANRTQGRSRIVSRPAADGKGDHGVDKRAQYPGALFVCHPESAPEVSAIADHVCSTSGMYEWCRASTARQFIIGTEPGILYRLRLENPHKKFILATPALICPNMKLTSPEDVLASLQTMSPRVTVDEDIRRRARAALDRMLAVPRD